MHSPRVRLYARPDCHLCDDARRGLLDLRSDGIDFALEEVNIETDEQLHARYLERIPVVEVEGQVISELHLDADGLRARLATLSA
jgi:glutaredoxin